MCSLGHFTGTNVYSPALRVLRNTNAFPSVELVSLKCLVILECVLIFVSYTSDSRRLFAEHTALGGGRAGFFRAWGSQALTGLSGSSTGRHWFCCLAGGAG